MVCSLPGCNSFFFLFFSPVLLHVSTLFVTLSSRFFLFFPSKFHQIFLLFHEIACVHFLDSLNISFFSPLHFVFVFFLGGKSGEGDFRHGSVCGSVDALRFVYILSFSLVLVAVSDSNLGLKSSYRFNCVHRLSGFGFGSDS